MKVLRLSFKVVFSSALSLAFLLAILESVSVATGLVASEWAVYPQATRHTLFDVTAPSHDSAWAVGEQGVILHFSGDGWLQADSPAMVTLRAVVATAQGDGWAVGDGGSILKLEAGSWTVSHRVPDCELTDVAVGVDGTVLVSGNFADEEGKMHGTFLALRDGAWSRFGVYEPAGIRITLESVTLTDEYNYFAVGAVDSITRGFGYSVIGQRCDEPLGDWRKCVGIWEVGGGQNSFPLLAVDMRDDGALWSVGVLGTIFHLGTDTGFPGGIIPRPYEVWRLNSVSTPELGIVVAAGTAGTIIRGEFGEWQRERTPGVTAKLHGVDMIDGSQGWAVGENGTILRYGPKSSPAFRIAIPYVARSAPLAVRALSR